MEEDGEQEGEGTARDRHRIPVIDRMMQVMGVLERRDGGATIRELVQVLRLPRTTVYRLLNTLEQHEMVRRGPGGAYSLGPRLHALAMRVTGFEDQDLASLAMPHLRRLSEATGEGSKVSVREGGGARVIAAVPGTRDYALIVVPGQILPLHAGAAGKILLAHMAEPERAALLAAPLAVYTPRTLTDPKRLGAELTRIRRQGWAQDRGEYAPSINAVAAPIPDRAGTVVAALSLPFLAGIEPGRLEMLRAAVIAAAGAIAADLPTTRLSRQV